ncbi:hypothetical protein HOS99_gp117 [Staphylococcus phage phiSA_BS1]|uniref:Uncharacterized protein n=2 Tax=Baoshanvirus TaxID=2732969 RepID=A0A2R3ZY14_9CAUD|nr:hypothetical protein HOS99_gp117 [Staphylococcus phage phiSA_BS1]YP_009800039.1 hypothetical protein HOT02_gp199 [Staphylococcus phage phiSA_BS2]YP_009800042.1 hypothetical protein HOT02_gp202 [Staphylococcus phage phiSA_BS2]AVP40358.1 hypothetical protein [Staphylococcus phage phiSA_BS1]AVR55643.1 hypothetical protein phiSABS2_199 [Staphylococcus phage phiSA_BS2]AVR55646.1 hypothetical protein phiSABS2_202 [Staphylococcus phage phiSA_BS2]
MNINQMKTIKVKHLDTENKVTETYISHDQFKTSFIDEKWNGEKRSNMKYTIFGYYHTKTVVKSPYGSQSVRVFEFPDTHAEAELNHRKYTNDNEARYRIEHSNSDVRTLWLLAKNGIMSYQTVHNIFKNESDKFIIFNSKRTYNKFMEYRYNRSLI